MLTFYLLYKLYSFFKNNSNFYFVTLKLMSVDELTLAKYCAKVNLTTHFKNCLSVKIEFNKLKKKNSTNWKVLTR